MNIQHVTNYGDNFCSVIYVLFDLQYLSFYIFISGYCQEIYICRKGETVLIKYHHLIWGTTPLMRI
jgi:hypothetical protein